MACSSRGMDQMILLCQNAGPNLVLAELSTNIQSEQIILTFERQKGANELAKVIQQTSNKDMSRQCRFAFGPVLKNTIPCCLIILVNVTLVILRVYTEEIIRTSVL